MPGIAGGGGLAHPLQVPPQQGPVRFRVRAAVRRAVGKIGDAAVVPQGRHDLPGGDVVRVPGLRGKQRSLPGPVPERNGGLQVEGQARGRVVDRPGGDGRAVCPREGDAAPRFRPGLADDAHGSRLFVDVRPAGLIHVKRGNQRVQAVVRLAELLRRRGDEIVCEAALPGLEVRFQPSQNTSPDFLRRHVLIHKPAPPRKSSPPRRRWPDRRPETSRPPAAPPGYKG